MFWVRTRFRRESSCSPGSGKRWTGHCWKGNPSAKTFWFSAIFDSKLSRDWLFSKFFFVYKHDCRSRWESSTDFKLTWKQAKPKRADFSAWNFSCFVSKESNLWLCYRVWLNFLRFFGVFWVLWAKLGWFLNSFTFRDFFVRRTWLSPSSWWLKSRPWHSQSLKFFRVS